MLLMIYCTVFIYGGINFIISVGLLIASVFHVFLFIQVCGPPGMMNHISGDKAKDRSQGEVLSIFLVYLYLCSWL